MLLRPYEKADWPRLCEIHDRARLDELRPSGLGDAFLTLEQTAESEGLFDGAVTVAVLQGEVQGFVAFAEGELNWLYVDPPSYRQGIGGALLRHAIEHSGKHLSTEVLLGNDGALALYLAEALYSAEGFKVVKRVDGRLTGNESFPASGHVLERENT